MSAPPLPVLEEAIDPDGQGGQQRGARAGGAPQCYFTRPFSPAFRRGY